VEMESEKLNAFFSSGYHRGKVLIEDDRENGGGKGRVGEIIHRPAKDLTFLNRHIEVKDAVIRRAGDAVSFFISASSRRPITLSIFNQTVRISCRIKTR